MCVFVQTRLLRNLIQADAELFQSRINCYLRLLSAVVVTVAQSYMTSDKHVVDFVVFTGFLNTSFIAINSIIIIFSVILLEIENVLTNRD